MINYVQDWERDEDTPEIKALLEKMNVALNDLTKAVEAGHIHKMDTLSTEVDNLTQEIFEAREKTLRPYPATAPSPLTEQDSAFLPPEWKQFLTE